MTTHKQWINLDVGVTTDPKKFIETIAWALDHVKSMKESLHFTNLAIDDVMRSISDQIKSWLENNK